MNDAEFCAQVLSFRLHNGHTLGEYATALGARTRYRELSLEEREHQRRLGREPSPGSVGAALAGDLARVLEDLGRAFQDRSRPLFKWTGP